MKDQTTNETFHSILTSLEPYISMLWEKRRILFSILGIGFVLIISFAYFFMKPYYVCTVTILPDYGNRSLMGSFSQLASLAGVSVGDVTPTEVYENLVTSESVLEPVIKSKYYSEIFKDSLNLIEYFRIEPDDKLTSSLQERDRFLRCYNEIIKSRIKTNLSSATNILDINVTMPESKLCADLINNIVKSLDDYVRTKRKSYASNQRYYLEKRLDQVKDSLILAEESLKFFKEKNKVIDQSPSLILEQSRMYRNVDILQTVFIQITQQLELAKIDEIRDAPILNIKEFAKDPIKKTGPSRTLYCLIIMFIFGTTTIAYFIYENRIKHYSIELDKFFRNTIIR